MALDVEIVREAIPGVTMAVGGALPAIGLGYLGGKAMEAIGRNPEAGTKIQTIVVLLAAFIEAIAIYSLVIALILRFV